MNSRFDDDSDNDDRDVIEVGPFRHAVRYIDGDDVFHETFQVNPLFIEGFQMPEEWRAPSPLANMNLDDTPKIKLREINQRKIKQTTPEEKKPQLTTQAQISQTLTHPIPVNTMRPYRSQSMDWNLYLIKGTGVYIYRHQHEQGGKNYPRFADYCFKMGLEGMAHSVYGHFHIIYSNDYSVTGKQDYEMNKLFYSFDLYNLTSDEKAKIPTIPLKQIESEVEVLSHGVGTRRYLAARLGRLFEYGKWAEENHQTVTPFPVASLSKRPSS